MNFDARIKDVVPMLEVKGLYGTVSLIKDLKQAVDDCAEIRAKAIEEFAERLRQECLKSPYKEVWLHTILKIAKELKGE